MIIQFLFAMIDASSLIDGGLAALYLSKMIRPFISLFLLTCLGIFIHELCHHLFGIKSLIGLSRNYPLETVTDENTSNAIFGTLAGPIANLFLGYVGLFMFSLLSNKTARALGFYIGVSNCFIALSSAVINLAVDSISGNMGNDLEQVSSILGLNIFILPVVFFILSLIPFLIFWKNYSVVALNRASFMVLIFLSWLFGGSALMILDSIFAIRFSLI